jgi:hypothetical protein
MSKRAGGFLGGGTILSKRTPGYFSGDLSDPKNHQGPVPRSAAERKALENFASEQAGPPRLIKARNASTGRNAGPGAPGTRPAHAELKAGRVSFG